ncbi:16S rRNA (uracil(1498)-N(3))-methyltransferase [Corynebacterium falsenii]|uniref:16S rRNA (uracil(1498)-N(3))-methyltransferase n=1 Tax=Corynebacterium falsenii TaxID=108486 RepID=UPI001D62B0E5|nr:16S rRNA (uracil(1498)-N(3))-methyltransferase [Corynebacterium falsenii]HJF11382.1 16S rRNA (uracil(1498)-N(3))-methyltransferase [Corynebacterium falsenii]
MTDPVFIHPIPDPTPAAGECFSLTGAEAKHAEVKRLEEGERVVVTDGSSRAVRGRWRAGGLVEVAETLTMPEPRPRVTVVQAIPKSDRAELAVDLAVQAGADRIVPWAAARCIAKWGAKEDKARAKWGNAARSAAKQSRRLVVPEVTELLKKPKDLDRLVPGESRTVLLLHEEASIPLAKADLDVDDVVLVVGPEGGIAPEELEAFRELGGQPVVLGPEVLRTATAAAVALGALGVLTARWDGTQNTTYKKR